MRDVCRPADRAALRITCAAVASWAVAVASTRAGVGAAAHLSTAPLSGKHSGSGVRARVPGFVQSELLASADVSIGRTASNGPAAQTPRSRSRCRRRIGRAGRRAVVRLRRVATTRAGARRHSSLLLHGTPLLGRLQRLRADARIARSRTIGIGRACGRVGVVHVRRRLVGREPGRRARRVRADNVRLVIRGEIQRDVQVASWRRSADNVARAANSALVRSRCTHSGGGPVEQVLLVP